MQAKKQCKRQTKKQMRSANKNTGSGFLFDIFWLNPQISDYFLFAIAHKKNRKLAVVFGIFKHSFKYSLKCFSADALLVF